MKQYFYILLDILFLLTIETYSFKMKLNMKINRSWCFSCIYHDQKLSHPITLLLKAPDRISYTHLSCLNKPKHMLYDTARIHVAAGNGGSGCVSFRHEKCSSMGGPSGGRGGSGGSVFFYCDTSLDNFAFLRSNVHVQAGKGNNGMGKSKDGSRGNHTIVCVPPGTSVREMSSGNLICSLQNKGEMMIVACGGRGGRGNEFFKTERYKAPNMAEKSKVGEEKWLYLKLDLLSDVGFLGKPNVGKSTLLAAVTNACPKIGDYPFTTINPRLGVYKNHNYNHSLVLCDLPGLVEGACMGIGMGYAFLRHVKSCKVLLHIIDGMSLDPVSDYHVIQRELLKGDKDLVKTPQVVIVNKTDISKARQRIGSLVGQLREAAEHTRILGISAITKEGVNELMGRLINFVDKIS